MRSMRIRYSTETSAPAPKGERLHHFLHEAYPSTEAAIFGLSGATDNEAHNLGFRWHNAADKLKNHVGYEVRGNTSCLGCGREWHEEPGPLPTEENPHGWENSKLYRNTQD